MLTLQAGLGKYCVHLLTDYITQAAAPPLVPTACPAASASTKNSIFQPMEALTGLPAAALRQGALALYGACSLAEASSEWLCMAACCEQIVYQHVRQLSQHLGCCCLSYSGQGSWHEVP